jgi:uncharacterized protein (DUF1015 family)
VVQAIAEAVASAPVVIADGHHRFETALAYRDERREAAGGAPGDYDLMMMYVVELAEEQLTVRAIHRVVRSVPLGVDLLGQLEAFFEPYETAAGNETVMWSMADAGSMALVEPGQTTLLRPRAGAFEGVADLDTARLDAALASIPGVELDFQHDPATVAEMVQKGDAAAGVLVRPASVATIADFARSRRLMPEKTTFFHPKPRTGMVFRRVS